MVHRTVTVLMLILVSTSIMTLAFNIEHVASEVAPWWDTAWRTRLPVNLTETVGIDRVDEHVDIFLSFDEGTCHDPEREVRVLSFDGSDWSEVPSQVYNVSYNGINATSCNVVFMANCSADNTVTYYVHSTRGMLYNQSMMVFYCTKKMLETPTPSMPRKKE